MGGRLKKCGKNQDGVGGVLVWVQHKVARKVFGKWNSGGGVNRNSNIKGEKHSLQLKLPGNDLLKRTKS